MQDRVCYLVSIFAAIGRRRQRPNLRDLAAAMCVSVGRVRTYLRRYRVRSVSTTVAGQIAVASAGLLQLDPRQLRAYVLEGDSAIVPALRACHERFYAATRNAAEPWALRVYAVLAPFGATGLHHVSAFRPAQQDLARLADIPAHRLGKLVRQASVPTWAEARRLAGPAATLLGMEAEAVWRYIEEDDEQIGSILGDKAQAAQGCVACGNQATALDPLVVRQGVHRSCLRARRNPQQAAWVQTVQQKLEDAPTIIQTAWRTVLPAGGPITFHQLAAAAGLPQRDFRRIWELASLPRRPSGRPTNPMRGRSRRMLWIDTVDRLIEGAPPELRGLWLELRSTGRPLTFGHLIECSGLSAASFGRAWRTAGLPGPFGDLPGAAPAVLRQPSVLGRHEEMSAAPVL